MEYTNGMPIMRLRTQLDNEYAKLMQTVIDEFGDSATLRSRVAKVKHHWIRGADIPMYAMRAIASGSKSRRDNLNRYSLIYPKLMLSGTIKSLLINRGYRAQNAAFSDEFAEKFIYDFVDPMQCSLTDEQVDYIRDSGVRLYPSVSTNLKTGNIPVYHTNNNMLPIETPEQHVKLNGRRIGHDKITGTGLVEINASAHKMDINKGDMFFLDLGDRHITMRQLFTETGVEVDSIRAGESGIVVSHACNINTNAVLLP